MTVPKSSYFTSASYFSGTLFEISHTVKKHFNLEENNHNLQLENMRLRSQIPAYLYEAVRDSMTHVDSNYHQQYQYVPAAIINSTTTKRNNFFTLNVGSIHGIRKGLGVFSSNGVVGIIHASSEHFSLVKSVLTSDINIDVMIEGNGAFGLLKWDGKNPNKGQISGITNDIKIPINSNVVTRGGSGIFPRGLTVGKVTEVTSVEGKSVWRIEIQFSEKYAVLENTYIVKNLFMDEMTALQTKNEGY